MCKLHGDCSCECKIYTKDLDADESGVGEGAYWSGSNTRNALKED